MKFFHKKKRQPNDQTNTIQAMQSNRIDELKIENEQLKNKISEFIAKESSIAEAILSAQKSAREYEAEAKLRFSIECRRLDNYRSQWIGRVDSICAAKNLGENIIQTKQHLDKCALELHKIIEEELFSMLTPENETYFIENERTSKLKSDDCKDNYSHMSNIELKRLIDQLGHTLE
ncbi:MAG: hypothetical protein LBF68_00165 [Christensenellaceae bacterium]|jgi:cell division septum initiation protein DivIVA|nr:hypothetical protein [Christensenellaceae bacterium]